MRSPMRRFALLEDERFDPSGLPLTFL